MFVLNFVPTIYDEPALQVLIGYHIISQPIKLLTVQLSQILGTNFKTNIETLQRTFRTYKRTLEVIFQKHIEIESNSSADTNIHYHVVCFEQQVNFTYPPH